MKRLLLILTICAGCSHPLEPTFNQQENTATAEFSADGNLVQRIVITNPRPAKGEDITVKSVVLNGGVTRNVTTRICNLDLSGVDLVATQAVCAGYSASATLATNDSIVQSDTRMVNSGTGDYTLRIRHLLNPERWVEVKLHVK